MRVSTGMIFDVGINTINRQTASLLHLQQQVATGRRVLTPADDPVAAARALVVQQAKDVNDQFKQNFDNARSAQGLAEAQLSSVGDLLARVRELAVQAGNDTLSAQDRRSVAFEMRSRFEELLGIANATDGAGQYLFSGYRGDTKPFGGSVDNLIVPGNEILYQGDDGQRRLQLSNMRFIETSDSGNDIFNRIRNGNGHFATGYGAANAGTGVIDAGSVTDPALWNNAANSKNLEIRFYVDSTQTPPVTYYDLVDATNNVSMLTGVGPVVPAFPGVPAGLRVYQENQPIVLSGLAMPYNDLGATVSVSGAPADGDRFTLTASSSQSVFKTIANLIGALEGANTSTPAGAAKLANEVGFALTNLDQASDNMLRVRAMIGARLSEIDSLGEVNAEFSLQYQTTISQLQDLDYAKGISDMQRKQLDLEAAQKSFMRVSQLSLFSYL